MFSIDSTTPLAEMEIDRHNEEFELSFQDEEGNIGDVIPVLILFYVMDSGGHWFESCCGLREMATTVQ
ncbi:hypothetical protein DPMN_005289 [Dreissena polymorpha]|uniref:Uncharacterized protein n=1 Tax=Dreissena polymorpha TaxID=45954 RepID=A0A9D4MT83_DREPO|nr:hypothetical protein DPMN_005289 [Dreissena polymorpha]